MALQMVLMTAVTRAESLAAYWVANWAAQRVLHWDRSKVASTAAQLVGKRVAAKAAMRGASMVVDWDDWRVEMTAGKLEHRLVAH